MAKMLDVLAEGDNLPEPLAGCSRDRAAMSGRRNLVFMRAGDNALFPTWHPAPSRTWDLAVSYYGDRPADWGQEFFVAEKGPKWQPIHRWLTDNDHVLKKYDYFWFADDDLATTWDNVNRLFQICRDFDLQLAQPALTDNSFVSHAITRRQEHCLLRFTMFVETMAPVLHADALRLCMPVMQEVSRYGWGHDCVFPKLLGYPQNKIAIIDACAVHHTRPVSSETDTALAVRQMQELCLKYGAKIMDHRVRGCMFPDPEATGTRS